MEKKKKKKKHKKEEEPDEDQKKQQEEARESTSSLPPRRHRSPHPCLAQRPGPASAHPPALLAPSGAAILQSRPRA